MKRKTCKMAGAILLGLLAGPLARAEVPEAFRKLWNDPEVVRRIDQNIERYRKADAALEVADANGGPIAGAKVTAEQQTHEFLFGCNLYVLGQLDTPDLNRKYEKAFVDLFNFATLPFFWGDLEPQEGKPRFAEGSDRIWRRPPPDRLVKWCKTHDIMPKGALLYVKNIFMPEWTDRKAPEAFMKQARKYMAEIAARYGRDIAVWDVINEEIPRLAHPDQWHMVPDDYPVQCFEEAGRLFPKDVRLLINEGTSQTHVTTALYEEKVKALLARGVRVEGIGIQFHLYGRSVMLHGKLYPPKQLSGVYERIERLGLPLFITEITIPGTGQNGPELQAAIVSNLYRLWFSTPKMAGITWWNLADGTAYGKESDHLGGLLDKDMNPKAAYQSLDRLINHEWKTRIQGTTDADGRFAFRGFKGGYRVTVRTSDGTRQFQIDLGPGGKSHKLVLVETKD